MSELKPCPFCGGEPWIDAPIPDRWTIGCSDEDCFVHSETATSWRRKSDAIAAWNRRAPGWEAGAEAMREAAVQFHREEGLGEKHLAEAAALNGDKDSERKHRALQTEHRMSAAAIHALPLPEPPK